MLRSRLSSLLISTTLLTSAMAVSVAQKVPLITSQIDESSVTVLAGNVRAEANAANDLGPTDSARALPNLILVLKRSAASQEAFDKYLAELTDPASPNFHKWLTNAQIGEKFGPATEDVTRLTEWLSRKGFTVHPISPDGMTLAFDGTVGQVKSAFHASIHDLKVNGAAHIGNMNDPDVPSALVSFVAGIQSLTDFMPHPMNHPRTTSAGKAVANGNGGNGYNYLGAADLATIYNFNPAFKAGLTGLGQTIAVVEDTDLYNLGDFLTFRKTFGLARPYPHGTLTQTRPAGTNTCTDPGVNGDDGEAAIDVEWSSAAAPNAAIVNLVCADTTTFGGFLALANALQGAVPNVVSISYGESEPQNGAASNLYIKNLYATATAQGVSIFVSSGDEGAASSDADRAKATHGISVSAFTSTPYNVSVGGTDYASSYLGTTANYFSPTNGPNYVTALSYVPEIPWNDSCASQLLATYNGFATTYGTGGYCNSAAASTNNEITTASGSGGPSGCATGVATTRGVVSGSCLGYPKPSWQSLFGNPADGVRDIPDVSLMAANGVWGFYYAVCYSDPNTTNNGGYTTTCLGDPSTWAGYGGTSISSPIWAGIQALVNQSTGQNWGNPNPVLYGIANAEYGSAGSASCNSEAVGGPASNCVFYDVTLGDNDVVCTGTHNCYINGGTNGVLSVSSSLLEPAYSTTSGWDFATGIGTTNATNLVTAFTKYAAALQRQ